MDRKMIFVYRLIQQKEAMAKEASEVVKVCVAEVLRIGPEEFKLNIQFEINIF